MQLYWRAGGGMQMPQSFLHGRLTCGVEASVQLSQSVQANGNSIHAQRTCHQLDMVYGNCMRAYMIEIISAACALRCVRL